MHELKKKQRIRNSLLQNNLMSGNVSTVIKITYSLFDRYHHFLPHQYISTTHCYNNILSID